MAEFKIGSRPLRSWRAHYWFRLHNAVRDIWDRRIRGLCVAAPSGYITGGAYHFWRCALKHGHDGPHRFQNYVWTDLGTAQYDPLRMMGDGPNARMTVPVVRRHPVLTRKQKRQRDEHHRVLDLDYRLPHEREQMEKRPATIQPELPATPKEDQ